MGNAQKASSKGAHFSTRKWLFLGVATLALTVVLAVNMLHAANNITITNTLSMDQKVLPHQYVGLFAVQFGAPDTGETLSSIKVKMNVTQSIGSTFDPNQATSSVLKDLQAVGGGLSIWKTANAQSQFFDSFNDYQQVLNNANYTADGTVTLTLSNAANLSANDKYYVVARVDDMGLTDNASVTFTLPTNGITTSLGAQTTNAISTNQLIVNATEPKIASIEYLNTGAPLAQGSQIRVKFNQSMKNTSIDSNNVGYNFYCYNPSNYTSGSFGTNPSVVWSKTQSENDTLTVTIGTSPTLADGMKCSPSASTATSGKYVYDPFYIKTQQPTLQTAQIVKGANGQFKLKGDAIVLLFSEAIDEKTLNGSNSNTALTLSGGQSWAAAPLINWTTPNIAILTLRANQSTNLGDGTTTIDAANSVKSIYGFADNTTAQPAILFPGLGKMTLMTLAAIDEDNSISYGINNSDLSITHQMSPTTDSATHYAHFWVVPMDGRTIFNTSSLFRVNSSGVVTNSTTPQKWVGTSSTHSLYYDSRTNYAGTSGVEYNSLQANYPYVVFGATSLVENPISVGDYGIAKPSGVFVFSSESSVDYTKPEVIGVNIANGAKDIGTNLKGITVQFSETVNAPSVNGNVKLAYDNDANGTYETDAAGTSLFTDTVSNTVTVVIQNTLVASKKYQLSVSTAVTDMANNGLATTYNTVFTTGSSSVTTSAKVSSSSITNNATNVSATTSDLRLTFDKPINWSTVQSANLTLVPLVAGTLTYDVNANAIVYKFSQALTGNTSYQLTLNETTQNIYNQFLDGDSNNTAGGNYVLNLQTGSLDTGGPSISSVAFNDSEAEVVFDKQMTTNDVTNANSWTLTCNNSTTSYSTSTGSTSTYSSYGYSGTSTNYTVDTSSTASTVSLSNAKFEYAENKLKISGLYLVQNASCTITASQTVRSAAGTAILSSGSSKTGTVTANYDAAYSASSTVGSSTYDYYTATYSQASAWAKNQTSGATTTYSIYLPMNGVSLPSGSKLKVAFPSTFTVTSATPDPSNYYFTDWNGSSTGTITMSSASVDNATKTVSITLNGTVGANDYLNFDIQNVVNGDAAEIDYSSWSSTTNSYEGGYQLSFTAAKSDGTSLFSGVKSYQFSVASAGTGSISGKVKDANSVGVSGVTIQTWGPSGEISATTNSSGDYTLSGLSNYTYYLYGNYDGSYIYGNTGYTISSTAQTVTGADFTVSTKSDTINVTLTHSASLAGKKVSLYCWDQKSYENVSKTVTLASGSSSAITMSVTPGTKSCSVYESYDWSSSATSYNYESSFTAPAPKNVTVTSGVAASVTFALSSADKAVTGFVYDQSGTGLANVSISVGSRSGSSAWTQSKSDGSFSVNVSADQETTYIVSAYQDGMGYFEKEVVVSADGTTNPTSVVFKMSKTSSTITGSVLDENNNAMQWVSITAKSNDGSTQYTSTDSTGKYTLFVAAGTWTVNANSWDKGTISCTAGSAAACSVTVAKDGTGTANFKYDTSKVATISGTVKVDNVAVQYASVWAELYDTTTGKQVGFTPAWSSTDSTGAFTLTVSKNSGTQRYRVQAWTYNNGMVGSKENIDVSTSNSTANTITSNATTVTVTVTNAPSGVSSVSLSAANSSDTKDIGKWNSITLTNGSGSTTFALPKGTTQKVLANISGYGDQKPTSVTGGTLNSDGTIAFTDSTATATFNLSTLSTSTSSITVSGTVKAGSTAVAKANVQLFDPVTGSSVSTYTDASGAYSLKAKAGSYKLFASRTGYVGSETTVTSTSTKDITMTAANSTITGVLKQSGATVDAGSVWVKSTDTTATWAQASVNADGTWSVAVPSGKTFKVYGLTKTGYQATQDTVSSGASSVSLNATTQLVTSFANPVSTGTTPGSGAVLDDRTNASGTGVAVTIPGSAYTNSNQSDTSGTGTLTAKEVVVADSVSGFDAMGATAIEVKQTDSSGNPVTTFSTPVTMNLVVSKTDVAAAVTSGDITHNQIDNFQLGFFDTPTQSWQTLATTQTCEVQTTSSGSFAAKSCSGLVDDLKTGVSYNDYRITLKAATNHFTIFGAVVPSDSTAPSAPAGLTATAASSTSVTLSWTASTETDLLNYNVYRSTTSGFTPSSTTQINTSEVTSAAYTDSGLTAGTTYYYKVTAVDNSGNESSGSSQASVAPGASTSSSSSSSSTTSGGGAASSDDDSTASEDSGSSDDSTGTTTEDAGTTAEATPEETGLDYTGHWAESYIQILVDKGVVSGYADAPEGYEVYYAPDNNLTRAELAKIVVNLFEYVTTTVEEMPFVDVDVDEWYAPFVAKLKDLGVVEGYADGTYAPGQAITRGEALKLLLSGSGKDVESYLWESNPFDDVDSDEWYAPYVLYAYDHGYVGGYKDADGNLTGEFGPGNEVTRAEMSKMAVQVAGLAE